MSWLCALDDFNGLVGGMLMHSIVLMNGLAKFREIWVVGCFWGLPVALFVPCVMLRSEEKRKVTF